MFSCQTAALRSSPALNTPPAVAPASPTVPTASAVTPAASPSYLVDVAMCGSVETIEYPSALQASATRMRRRSCSARPPPRRGRWAVDRATRLGTPRASFDVNAVCWLTSGARALRCNASTGGNGTRRQSCRAQCLGAHSMSAARTLERISPPRARSSMSAVSPQCRCRTNSIRLGGAVHPYQPRPFAALQHRPHERAGCAKERAFRKISSERVCSTLSSCGRARPLLIDLGIQARAFQQRRGSLRDDLPSDHNGCGG
jgi:hypothetical protein